MPSEGARDLMDCKRWIAGAVQIINEETEAIHELIAGDLPPGIWDKECTADFGCDTYGVKHDGKLVL